MDNKNYKGLIVKICCFLASFSLWVYISSIYDARKSDTIYDLPIEITGEDTLRDKNLIMLSDQDITMDIKVQGDINILTKLKKEDFSLSIDLSNYKDVEGLTKGVLKAKVDVLGKPSDVTILNEKDLTKDIDIDDYIEKNMDVSINQVNISDKDIVINSIKTDPQKIKVKGAKTLVDKVKTLGADLTYDDIVNDNLGKAKVIAKDKNGKDIEKIELEKKYVDIDVDYDNIKEVKVSPSVTGKLPQNLELDDLILGNKTIKIKGKKSRLDNVTEIKTEEINLSKLSGDTTINAKLILPEGVKAIAVSAVSVEVVTKEKEKTSDESKDQNEDTSTSDEVIEKKLTLPINVNNLPEDLAIELKNSTINITISGKKSIIDSVKESDFKAYIDGSVLTLESNSAKVIVENNVADITVKDVDIQEVEITVTNKNKT